MLYDLVVQTLVSHTHTLSLSHTHTQSLSLSLTHAPEIVYLVDNVDVMLYVLVVEVLVDVRRERQQLCEAVAERHDHRETVPTPERAAAAVQPAKQNKKQCRDTAGAMSPQRETSSAETLRVRRSPRNKKQCRDTTSPREKQEAVQRHNVPPERNKKQCRDTVGATSSPPSLALENMTPNTMTGDT